MKKIKENKNLVGFRGRVSEYCTQVKLLRDNPKEIYPLEFDNALDCRGNLEEDLKKIKETPEYKEFSRKIKETDNALRKLFCTKDSKLLRQIMNAYGGMTIENIWNKKDWWWHPERINSEAIKYLPSYWPRKKK